MYTTRQWLAIKSGQWWGVSYWPFYFGLKIISRGRENGRSASYQLMSASELKEGYQLIAKLFNIAMSAASLSMIANAAAKVATDRGQIALLCNHNYDSVFSVMNQTFKKIQYNLEWLNEKMDSVSREVELLDNYFADRTSSIFKGLQGDMNRNFLVIEQRVLELSVLHLNPSQIIPKADRHDALLRELLDKVVHTQRLSLPVIYPQPLPLLTEDQQVIMEQKLQRIEYLQKNIHKEGWSIGRLYLGAGLLLMGVNIAVNQLVSEENQYWVMSGVGIAAILGLPLVPVLFNALNQRARRQEERVSLSDYPGTIYNSPRINSASPAVTPSVTSSIESKY